MKIKAKLLLALLISSLLILASCATSSTRLASFWKDDNYRGHVKHILVMAVAENQQNRRFYETEFVTRLKSKGIKATPGFSLFPSNEKLDKAAIESKIKGTDIDAVIVTRVVERRTEKSYVPPTSHPTFSGYYGASYSMIYQPGYTVEDEVVAVESNLYDTATSKLIWSASSETFIYATNLRDSTDAVITKYIKMLIDNLSKQDLF